MPAGPTPADGAVSVRVDTQLTWWESTDDGVAPIEYDIYFGTESPPPLVSTGTDTTYRPYAPPNSLEYDTWYYWQIVARDDVGQ